LAFRPFPGCPSLGEVGWPFSDVLRETQTAVTRQNSENGGLYGCHGLELVKAAVPAGFVGFAGDTPANTPTTSTPLAASLFQRFS